MHVHISDVLLEYFMSKSHEDTAARFTRLYGEAEARRRVVEAPTPPRARPRILSRREVAIAAAGLLLGIGLGSIGMVAYLAIYGNVH